MPLAVALGAAGTFIGVVLPTLAAFEITPATPFISDPLATMVDASIIIRPAKAVSRNKATIRIGITTGVSTINQTVIGIVNTIPTDFHIFPDIGNTASRIGVPLPFAASPIAAYIIG
jgi:hypothetical protein